MTDFVQNSIHQLFFEFGVNLDYVPENKYEAFTMLLQFVAAFFVHRWFIKFLFSFVRSMYGGRW